MYGVDQPTMGAWFQAKLMSTSPAVPVRAPKTSQRTQIDASVPSALSCGRGSEGMMNCPRTAQAKPTIPPTHKFHGHHANCAKIAAKTPPSMKPPGAVAPKMLNTISFLLPFSYLRPSSAMLFGSRNAGPIPCIARQTSKNIMPFLSSPTYTLNPARRVQMPYQMKPRT